MLIFKLSMKNFVGMHLVCYLVCVLFDPIIPSYAIFYTCVKVLTTVHRQKGHPNHIKSISEVHVVYTHLITYVTGVWLLKPEVFT